MSESFLAPFNIQEIVLFDLFSLELLVIKHYKKQRTKVTKHTNVLIRKVNTHIK